MLSGAVCFGSRFWHLNEEDHKINPLILIYLSCL